MEAISIVAVICLLLVAVAFSPLGLGGGILYVPIMHYMLEWEIEESLVASLTLVLMVALGSSMAHSKSGHADKEVAKLGRISAVPSAVIGVILSGALISTVGDIGIKIIASIIVFFVIERTLRKTLSKDESDTIELPITVKKNQYIAGTSFAGISAGLLGIGGGAILVTLNRSILKMDSKKAAGTSYLIAATITPVALISHLIMSRNLSIIIDDAGILAMIMVPVLVFASAYFGAKYAIKYLPKQIVSYVFLFVVSVSLFRYLSDLISQI
ncbi:MAG: TSUP family transporter [Candidatus Poseidoniaceae archaeon]